METASGLRPWHRIVLMDGSRRKGERPCLHTNQPRRHQIRGPSKSGSTLLFCLLLGAFPACENVGRRLVSEQRFPSSSMQQSHPKACEDTDRRAHSPSFRHARSGGAENLPFWQVPRLSWELCCCSGDCILRTSVLEGLLLKSPGDMDGPFVFFPTLGLTEWHPGPSHQPSHWPRVTA